MWEVGPLLGIIAGPVIAPVLSVGGIAGTYLLLAATAVIPSWSADGWKNRSRPRLRPANGTRRSRPPC